VRSLSTLALVLWASTASAQIRIRMGTIAPDGTNWAREVHAFIRDVETSTRGAVSIKFYFGGIAGDENEMQARIARDQLDGAGAGGRLCESYSPAMRVMRLPGLFQTRGEASYILARLKDRIDTEMSAHGMINIAETPLGADVVFSKVPIHTLNELRRVRLMRWDTDEVGNTIVKQMGFDIHPMTFPDARRAFDEGEIDAVSTIPGAALAWQISSRARYLLDLRIDYVVACMAVSARAFQRLPFDHQQALRAAAAKLALRLDDAGRQQDEQLMHGAFARQGLTVVVPDEQFRREFFSAARRFRGGPVLEKFLPESLINEVASMLADYRAEHRAAESP
jgi:TRAP-type C4-dicarboxylate transport system substrate-binding protein